MSEAIRPEWWFYHLSRSALEVAAPPLMQKCLEAGWRVLAVSPDMERLAKLDAGQYDAIILAAAGLNRLQLSDRIRAHLDCAQFIPAIAQGALGIEYPRQRADMAACLAPFANAETTAMVTAERAMGRALTASCDVPLGARAVIAEGVLRLEGFVAMPDGSRMIRDRVSGSPVDAEKLGLALAEKLFAAGAQSVLDSLGRHAG